MMKYNRVDNFPSKLNALSVYAQKDEKKEKQRGSMLICSHVQYVCVYVHVLASSTALSLRYLPWGWVTFQAAEQKRGSHSQGEKSAKVRFAIAARVACSRQRTGG